MVAAPERPARRKSNVQYNEQESSELSDDDPDSGSSPPPRKRARGRAGASGSKAKKKGKAKQTSKLLEMPLDVMFEVSTSRNGAVWGSGGSRRVDPRLRRTKGFVATFSDIQGSSGSHHEQIEQVHLARFLRRRRRGTEMPRGYFRARMGAVVVWSVLSGMSCSALFHCAKNWALKRRIPGAALFFFASYGYLLGFVPPAVQKMPSRGVCLRGQ